VIATDPDESDEGKLRYSLIHVSGGAESRFRLNATSGQLQSVNTLRFGERFSLSVRATDSAAHSSDTIVELQVGRGANLRPPQFDRSDLQFELSEALPVPHELTTLHANDPERERIAYELIAGNEAAVFELNRETGGLTVIRALDREREDEYRLTARAVDDGGLFSTCRISIVVRDVNDHNPTFALNNYTFAVDEGQVGALVGQVSATDADADLNGQVKYSLSQSGDSTLFSVDESTGQVRTVKALDFEQTRSHKLLITARDCGTPSRQSSVIVIVLVQDISDEPPRFVRRSAHVHIRENCANCAIWTLQAIDADQTPQITYKLVQGDSNLFVLNSRSGRVSTAASGLDFERQKLHKLTFGTNENPSSEIDARFELTIHVHDANDHKPEFDYIPLPVRISDRTAVGSTVARVHAIDRDGSAANNVVHYELIPQTKESDHFHVDSTSGVITLKGDLHGVPESDFRVSAPPFPSISVVLRNESLLIRSL
jgi:hypothetical protein